ncbi:MAG TPA: FHA domain-containing protein [Deltaproteobacteria bacterium]|nr:FHA domain-containing protein [Deltaproteobacteria bacterium]
MPIINLPAAAALIEPQPFTSEHVEHMLDELCTHGHDFTGYVRIDAGDSLFMLFIFGSRPYAAGVIDNGIPRAISLRSFFKEAGRVDEHSASISIHATDPPLLKSLLVYIQNRPLIRIPAAFTNLDAAISQFRQDAADALIVLKAAQHLDFCFFKSGQKAVYYTSDPATPESCDIPADMQLKAAMAIRESETVCLFYRNIATEEDPEALVISQKEMLELLRGKNAAVQSNEHLALSVLEGPQRGERLSGTIPCVLGRKDTDIIISDPLVSKRHAAVQLVNGKLIIMDLNSTNGTFLNGKQIAQNEINIGDDLLLGSTLLRVELLTPP